MPANPPIRAARLRMPLAVSLLGLTVAVTVAPAVSALREGQRTAEVVAGVPVVGGYAAIGGNEQAARFAAFVRSQVPADDTVQVVVPGRAGASVCGDGARSRGVYWAFVYQITPRASVCSGARWTAYVRVEPPSRPGDDVRRFAPGYALVRHG